jgi:monovalent cation:H+ antiporter-2, CPA2 family
MASSLELVLLYLIAAVAGVVFCRSVKLPPILGYLTVGVLIGPHALALAKGSGGVSYLAEFGVVFLMFVIGLEFNLPKLYSMRKLVFILGLSQVVLTMLGTWAGHHLLKFIFSFTNTPWELSWRGALVLGAAVAMSSTAIVVKLMAERLELESEHGRHVMGVLLLQDLAVVPLLVMIPALNSSPVDMAASLAWATLKAGALVTVLLVGGQKVMRWWLTLVARRKSEELFILNLLLITLGLAYLTEHAGLSLALGSFLAGMLIAETEYKHQVETDIRPFHDVLLGLFFITIGMKLDMRLVLDQWVLVLLLTTLPVLAKFILISSLVRILGAPAGVALRTGLYLAQAGEFGFVLLTLGADHQLISPQWASPVLASMVLSMLVTPFLIAYSDRIVMRLSANDWLMQSVAMTQIAKRAINTSAHVIIAGYGRSGQNLARLLERENIPYMALDLDPDRVRNAAAAGQSVVFGDAARLQSLMAAGLARANAVVVTYPDTASALKILHLVHSHAPKVPVIVRTIDDTDIEKLQAAGATEVVPEAIEGSLMLATHALALVGVPMRRVIRVVQEQRDARYGLLRGWFHGADDDTVDDLSHARLLSVTLPASAACLHQTLGDQALHAVGVTVASL